MLLTRRACLALPMVPGLTPSAGQVASPGAEPVRIALIEGLSGPFANAGEAVFRNLLWAVERINEQGGVRLPGGERPLALLRLDSKGNTEEALSLLRGALDQRITFIAQGNSSAAAAALIDALDKHNARDPQRRALLLNYSAVDPVLTNERCSFWHFRFDAHADMRLAALVDVLREDSALRSVYLIGQDYSFGQHVARRARLLLTSQRPDVRIVGDELHPLGRVKDFMPYATKIKASGAQAVLTGNWGNDLTLLVRALAELGSDARLYTFYGNALGTPAAIGEAGVGRVLAVAEWHPNAGGAASDAFYAAFRRRFPTRVTITCTCACRWWCRCWRKPLNVPAAPRRWPWPGRWKGRACSTARWVVLHSATMRAEDHQLQQPLVVSVMARAGTPGVAHEVEGSGFGFRTLRRFEAARVVQPHSCRMPGPIDGPRSLTIAHACCHPVPAGLQDP
jgi:branched-chain amino acid transport system substrate-binding protein